MTAIAFIGFGEAGSLLAEGLLGAGAERISTFDILLEKPEAAAIIQSRAADKGVSAVDTAAGAVADCDVVISAVVSNEMVNAARATAPHLATGQYYLDINSASPGMKREAAALVSAQGAHFVEAAVMDLVPPHGHRVPMLFAGEKADALAPILRSLGMEIETIGTEIGQASSVKMIRSVFLKGFNAILLECLTAAHIAGVEDRILDSIEGTYPDIDWRELASHHLQRLPLHAKRQAAEMWEVAETLRDFGLDPLTAEASARRLEWLTGLELLAKTPDGAMPGDYTSALELVVRAMKADPA